MWYKPVQYETNKHTAQARFRSAWVMAQSDQSLCYRNEDLMSLFLPIDHRTVFIQASMSKIQGLLKTILQFSRTISL